MKKIILSIAIIATVLVSCKENKKDKVTVNEEVIEVETTEVAENNLDLTASTITWKGTKPGGAHNGIVSLQSGSLIIEEGTLTSGEFVIDMNSISCEDLKAGDGKEKLEGHLKNADFFDVEKYPTAKFVITSVEENDDALAVTGNLTIKETTKSITIAATVSETDDVATFKSDVFKIDRTDFGVSYKSKKIDAALKDKFIDDLMEMSFEVKTAE